jgi:hypothetical protein
MLQKASKRAMRQIRRSTPKAAATASHAWAKARQALLVLAGFGFVDWGVFGLAGTWWGVIAVGLSLLVFEAITSADEAEPDDAEDDEGGDG